MAPVQILVWLLTCVMAGWLLAGSSAIVTKTDSKDRSDKIILHSKKDRLRDEHLSGETALERSSVYTANTYSSHHHPGYQAQATSYGFGYASGGSNGGSLGGGLGGNGPGHGLDLGGGHGGTTFGLGGAHGGSNGGFGSGHGGANGLDGLGGGGYGSNGFGDHHLPESQYHHHHHDHHVDHHVKHQQNTKTLALKGLLVPLAGVALLGAAAALVSNPVLLQLGVISGKRRRREAANTILVEQKLAEVALLERYMTAASKQRPVTHEKQLLANYLYCTGISSHGNSSAAVCLERLTCELHRPDTEATQLEKHVMEIVTSEILTNEFIPHDVKKRVKSAAETGGQSQNCDKYACTDFDD